MSFVELVRARARARPRRVVFPEGLEERTLRAALHLAREGLLVPVLLGSDDAPGSAAAREAGLEVLDPASDPRREPLAQALWERRRAKGMTQADAFAHAADPLVFGALMVGAGEVDGSVAGAVNTTGAVLRAALWGVGPAPGISTVSSSFYMVVPHFGGAREPVVFTFSDCAVVPAPDSLQLAEIAVAAAAAREKVVGDEPRVAFLSYSTRGSAEGPLVSRVREGLALFRERAPRTPADGELQLDAAVMEAVGTRKAPGSAVAGRANVLIFPDLNAGNIGYKLVERLGGAQAIGPIVQGLARPCNDLSRGASTEDIINVACITALMAE